MPSFTFVEEVCRMTEQRATRVPASTAQETANTARRTMQGQSDENSFALFYYLFRLEYFQTA